MATPSLVSPFDETLRAVVQDLRKLAVPWALVGGVAVSARGNPRFTNDFDFAIAVADDREAERTVAGIFRWATASPSCSKTS